MLISRPPLRSILSASPFSSMHQEASPRSTVHDLRTEDSLGGIPRIHHQLRFFYYPLVIVAGMVGDDQNAVVFSQLVKRNALDLQVVLPPLAN